jgi:p-hydroxybenzoate 3-monooxygenase
MRTQVAIIGAGPAGLLLSHLLARQGIESVVLERSSRERVERRIRAGVLEHGTVALLHRLGLADRLTRQGMVHHGLELLYDRRGHRLDLTALAGRQITIYGQHELVKDLIAARLSEGGRVLFEAPALALTDLTGPNPMVRFRHAGREQELRADVIAGCDGFHGVSRQAPPAGALTVHEHEYPYAWLGVLAQAPPSAQELIYAYHERGFALHSMRSPQLTRLYLQVPPGTAVVDWPAERVWSELATRLERDDAGWSLAQGPILEQSVIGLRSVVTEPMRYGRLFLAGDAAHIVPATGAKGLNLAVADVVTLAAGLAQWYVDRREQLLDGYSATCLARVWRVQHFSWWMTSMLHRVPEQDPFTTGLQLAQLRYLTSSVAAATSFAENYAGLPLTRGDDDASPTDGGNRDTA